MRRIISRWTGSFVVLTLTFATVLSAHHSMAMFRRDKQTTIQGRLVRFDWQNPHVIIAVETKGPNGELVTWTIETVYTSALLDAGWTRDSLKVGDQVTVSVNPHVDPSVHFANLNSVTKADGTILSPRRSGPASGPGNLPAPEGETNRVK